MLKYYKDKEKVLNCKLSPYDLKEISEGKKTVEEAYARRISFQNIGKIVSNFKALDNKLDIGTPLKKPYHRRKKNFYEQINEIFERRHDMVHHMDIDKKYDAAKIQKDIADIKVAMTRVYQYVCKHYGWNVQNTSL